MIVGIKGMGDTAADGTVTVSPLTGAPLAMATPPASMNVVPWVLGGVLALYAWAYFGGKYEMRRAR